MTSAPQKAQYPQVGHVNQSQDQQPSRGRSHSGHAGTKVSQEKGFTGPKETWFDGKLNTHKSTLSNFSNSYAPFFR
jgi:hypothetical protein